MADCLPTDVHIQMFHCNVVFLGIFSLQHMVGCIVFHNEHKKSKLKCASDPYRAVTKASTQVHCVEHVRSKTTTHFLHSGPDIQGVSLSLDLNPQRT